MPGYEDAWPPNSPDGSGIEIVWAWIKTQLKYIPSKKLNTKLKLADAVRAIWAAVDQKQIDKLLRDMPKKWKAIVAARGAYVSK